MDVAEVPLPLQKVVASQIDAKTFVPAVVAGEIGHVDAAVAIEVARNLRQRLLAQDVEIQIAVTRVLIAGRVSSP